MRGFLTAAYATVPASRIETAAVAANNDRRIPRELLARPFESFEVVFTQDRGGLASPGAGKAEPQGRIEISREVTEEELHALLVSGARQ